MKHLMVTFIRCLIGYLRDKDGGGISLGYDPSTRSIFVAFSSDKGIINTLNIDPRALEQDQFTQERVVKMLCDCLTHKTDAKQDDEESANKQRQEAKKRKSEEDDLYVKRELAKLWGDTI